MKLIIARHKEDISWAKQYPDKFIVQKGEHLPNVGREPASYLWYIVTHYEDLSGDFLFLQGNPYHHCKVLPEGLNGAQFVWLGEKAYACDAMAQPQDRVDLIKFMKEVGLDVRFKTKVHFSAGCQFMITAERIKRYPKEFYEKMLEVVQNEEKRYPWAFERMVGIIFGD